VLDKTSPKQLVKATSNEVHKTVRIKISFKDQRSVDFVRKQLKDLSNKIDLTIQPVFVNRKLNDDLKYHESKPPIVTQQRVVYEFKYGLCDANYVGYTLRHLHERCEEHKLPSFSIYKHFKNEHGLIPKDITNSFKILKKYT